MNFVLDLILVVICFLTVFIAAKKGFIRSVMGFVSKIVALIAAYTFTPTVAAYIKGRFLLAPLSDSIGASVKSAVTVDGGYDFSALSEKIPSILERYLISGEELTEKLETMQKTGDEALRFVSDVIADKVAGMIATAIAFIGIFVLVCVLLWVVTIIADAVFKLPVLRTANTVLGVLFGVLSAFIITLVYCSAVSLLVGALGSVAPKFFGQDVIDRTFIVKLFANADLIDIAHKFFS